MTIGRVARIVNMALGLWLLVSILVWPHTAAQTLNLALVGLLIAMTALFAWSTGPRLRLRLVNAALGLWLLVSIVAFPARSSATPINSAIVAVLVFLLALVPQRIGDIRPRTV